MSLNRREAFGLVGAASAAAIAPAARAASRGGTDFTADWASLVAGYRTPDWFRDAKFGIWAHWSAQCVPEAGDWYARNMYLQGTRANKVHLAKYGHPTTFGFMEIDNLWKAEHWEPERLIDLYSRAGAKYFVALANHHDNFDAFASKHHAWNATRIGPKKDLVGGWAKAARARGLRFGVSNHSSHAWHWFQPAYGYDAEGPMRDRRYDAWRLTRADGAGKWWEGLDPQDLYTGRNMPIPDGVGSTAEANAFHERVDAIWFEDPPRVNPRFAKSWALRCQDLVDSYRPDLLYFDDTSLPMGPYGLQIAAHYYNASRAWNGGRLEAVINAKQMPAERRMALVEDVERGGKGSIQTYPWQTDTCLGNWHYDRELYERNGYKTAPTVIHTLCDVVSKNGNLLLSVPVRGDGTIDDKEERIVEQIAAWMGRYGEAIHGSRPWRIYGEGPTKPQSGMFAEGGPNSPYTARDIRYVRKGADVHALVLGWPEDGVARLTTWAEGAAVSRGELQRVSVIGDPSPLEHRRTPSGLEVQLPERLNNPIGVALVLSGTGLTQGSLADA